MTDGWGSYPWGEVLRGETSSKICLVGLLVMKSEGTRYGTRQTKTTMTYYKVGLLPPLLLSGLYA